MSLSRDSLEKSLREIFSGLNGSRTIVSFEEAASRWEEAYFSYAGEAELSGGGKPNLVRGSLVSLLQGKDFLSELSIALNLLWLSVVWSPGGGFTYVTTSTGSFERPDLWSAGPEKVAKSIARALHTYTTMVTVTATNVSSGASSLVHPM
jgi:hypothetical protein